MENRISQMENQEVDYLRFDRIKIQRKRMEHILEVIKDLTFRNQELVKQNYLLKEGGQSQYKHLFEELSSERGMLIQKNIVLNSELQKYKETVVHQEILINSLKKQLYGHDYAPNQRQFTESWEQSKFKKKDAYSKENSLIMQEHMVLKEQYEDLQYEFNQLYKHLYQKGLESSKYRGSEKKLTRHQTANNFRTTIGHSNYQNQGERPKNSSNKQNKKQSGFGLIYEPQKNQKSNKSNNSIAIQVLSNQQIPGDLKLSKLRSKYQKTKQGKKQLKKMVKTLQQELNEYKEKEGQQNMLITSMKNKISTVCQCHINKLEKELSHQIIYSNTKIMDSLNAQK